MDNITPIGGAAARAEEDPRIAQLRELRARRAQLEEARRLKQDQHELERQLEAEAQAIRDEERLAELVEEHGAVGVELEPVHTDFGMVIVRRCGALRYRRFQDEEKNDVASMTAFVLPCVLHPSRDTVEKWLDRQPAILIRIGQAIGRMAGIRADLTAKK